METPTWKFRVDPVLKAATIEAAKAEGEDASSVLRRAMRAYCENPAAFNAACARIIEEGRR